MFKKPNFFIIGAPKCGTTSLAAWLSEHPNVFITNPKEPEFFNKDFLPPFKGGLAKYESLYEGVSSNHIAVGEASTGYLRSRGAVEEILRYAPDARFIVGLRNPVEMAISWHGQNVRDGVENELDFETAWRLQDLRRRGVSIPRLCSNVNDLMYADVCALGSQLERLYATVPRERVLIYTLDEMRSDPRTLWLKVLTFLGVPDDGRQIFPVHNKAKHLPLPLRVATRIIVTTKRKLGILKGMGVLTWISETIGQKPSRNVSKEFMYELSEHFMEEIELLQDITGYDLSHWINPQSITCRDVR